MQTALYLQMFLLATGVLVESQSHHFRLLFQSFNTCNLQQQSFMRLSCPGLPVAARASAKEYDATYRL